MLVHNGQVIAAEHNRVEENSDPTAHAEMLCLQHAAAQQGGWRLLQSSLYVTLEPCPMCAGAMLLSRVGTVIYGTNSPLLGECKPLNTLRNVPKHCDCALHGSNMHKLIMCSVPVLQVLTAAGSPYFPAVLQPAILKIKWISQKGMLLKSACNSPKIPKDPLRCTPICRYR